MGSSEEAGALAVPGMGWSLPGWGLAASLGYYYYTTASHCRCRHEISVDLHPVGSAHVTLFKRENVVSRCLKCVVVVIFVSLPSTEFWVYRAELSVVLLIHFK